MALYKSELCLAWAWSPVAHFKVHVFQHCALCLSVESRECPGLSTAGNSSQSLPADFGVVGRALGLSYLDRPHGSPPRTEVRLGDKVPPTVQASEPAAGTPVLCYPASRGQPPGNSKAAGDAARVPRSRLWLRPPAAVLLRKLRLSEPRPDARRAQPPLLSLRSRPAERSCKTCQHMCCLMSHGVGLHRSRGLT